MTMLNAKSFAQLMNIVMKMSNYLFIKYNSNNCIIQTKMTKYMYILYFTNIGTYVRRPETIAHCVLPIVIVCDEHKELVTEL